MVQKNKLKKYLSTHEVNTDIIAQAELKQDYKFKDHKWTFCLPKGRYIIITQSRGKPLWVYFFRFVLFKKIKIESVFQVSYQSSSPKKFGSVMIYSKEALNKLSPLKKYIIKKCREVTFIFQRG